MVGGVLGSFLLPYPSRRYIMTECRVFRKRNRRKIKEERGEEGGKVGYVAGELVWRCKALYSRAEEVLSECLV